jgi:regulator of PEP synthase PpsR (kinase-PPPase family)
MSDLTHKLSTLKREIASAVARHDKLKWEKDRIMKELSDEFGISSIDAAEKLLGEMEAKYKKDKHKLEQRVADLEEKYNAFKIKCA